MPDYIYLLENRLSADQQHALQQVREAAREAGMTVFLTGGAVRDLTSGSPVRDLDISVHGNALKLKKTLEKAGGALWGEHDASRTLFFRFPGSVRVEISGTRSEEFPKPGKPVYHQAPILEDLRRRDFTANAMALSLNEGSYGLLMDPLNGVADIEARQLRLVSNYGFLEDPIRLIRATRLAARLGWELEEKTRVRYQNAREEGVIESVSAYQQGYELEEIAHEEDGLKILRALEAEGWMQNLFAGWTSARADTAAIDELRESLIQLQMQGVNPDASSAQMQLLTAKMPPKELSALKQMIVRRGFVGEWDSLDADAKAFAKLLTGKESASASATWKLITSHQPEAVLWLALTSKAAPVRAKFKDFFSVWPDARQRIPYTLMQEMRITPDLPGYQDLLRNIFFELIDGRLGTEEELRAFLEPHSPPAPPPPVKLGRSRGKKAEAKAKIEEDEDEEIEIPILRDDDAEEHDDDADVENEEDEDAIAPVVKPPAKAKAGRASTVTVSTAPVSVAGVSAPKGHKEEPKIANHGSTSGDKRSKASAQKPVKKSPAKVEPKKAPVKSAAKPIAKPASKSTAPAAKKASAKPVPSRPAKKPVSKPPAKKVVVAKKPAVKPKSVAKKAVPAKKKR
jgi:tRNA nucleotidyltransferase (CCA-adding enzyme)